MEAKSIELKKRNWKKYGFEFLSIFVAVISAFALNNWNENRRDKKAENKILIEISEGLQKDLNDININIIGHIYGTNACNYWKRAISNEAIDKDSLNAYYFNFVRDFVAIQNTSGYENLKSRGLELVRNDSLRSSIISLYEYDYKTLIKLEEEYNEAQFHANYFKEINDVLAPNFVFDEKGNIVDFKQNVKISEKDRNILLSYFWKINANRLFLKEHYKDIRKNILKVIDRIDKEIN